MIFLRYTGKLPFVVGLDCSNYDFDYSRATWNKRSSKSLMMVKSMLEYKESNRPTIKELLNEVLLNDNQVEAADSRNRISFTEPFTFGKMIASSEFNHLPKKPSNYIMKINKSKFFP